MKKTLFTLLAILLALTIMGPNICISLNDADNDGVNNQIDNCPRVKNPQQKNSDGDEFGDACDNCPTTDNPDQADWNADGTGDACQDVDLDGVLDSEDNCDSVKNPDQVDTDMDGMGDECDPCPEDPRNRC